VFGEPKDSFDSCRICVVASALQYALLYLDMSGFGNRLEADKP
jgi:hypothetical protein